MNLYLAYLYQQSHKSRPFLGVMVTRTIPYVSIPFQLQNLPPESTDGENEAPKSTLPLEERISIWLSGDMVEQLYHEQSLCPLGLHLPTFLPSIEISICSCSLSVSVRTTSIPTRYGMSRKTAIEPVTAGPALPCRS